jgi:hypothetical protein
MPRNLVLCVALTACRFAGDYRGGDYTCSDNECPGDLICVADRCVAATADAPGDGTHGPDMRLAALTCADPGSLVQPASGSTAARTASLVSASCGGFVMNGPDAVYKVDATLGQHLLVTVTGSFAVKAYVLAPCLPSPQTPVCVGSTFATPGNPVSITTGTAGAQFIVVDTPTPNVTGTYTLTVE